LFKVDQERFPSFLFQTDAPPDPEIHLLVLVRAVFVCFLRAVFGSKWIRLQMADRVLAQQQMAAQ
jgi:hypothetical protein